MTTDLTSWDLSEVARFRKLQRERPRIPYERLGDSDRLDQKSEAVQILEEGWVFANFPRISVNPPIVWNEIAAENRSWEFRLHCWDFLGPALCVLDQESDDQLLSFAVSVAEDWGRSHPSLEVQSRMAWYDMAVGLRAHRLAFIVDLASRSASVSDSTVDLLLETVQLHQLAFGQEGIFKAHSNHGLYVAAGQRAMSRRLGLLPGMDEQWSQSDQRLRQMIATQFTSEGVHKEHSPDYHRMILSTVRHLHEADLIPDDSPVDIEAMEEALAWFVLPDRSLSMFGDTPSRQVSARADYVSPVLNHVATRGERGRAPAENWRSFPESGYSVYRSGWPAKGDDPEDWSYLALNAAFHSRAHKHADDLSFVWYDRRSHILIDPGRYGYLDPTTSDSELGKKGFYYGHPYRVYVEETRAHNAVDIDIQSYQRRGVQPYGSAIRRAGEQQGLFYAEAHAEHLTLDRSARVQHTRLLVLHAGEWLVVYDRLWDPRNRPHDYRQWFQFAPDLVVDADDIGWSAKGPDGWQLWAIPLLEGVRSSVLRGVTEPQLQGWISLQDNELEPTASVHVSASGKSVVSLATLFCFSETPPHPMGSSASDDRLSLVWATDARYDLTVELSEGEDIRLNLAIGNS